MRRLIYILALLTFGKSLAQSNIKVNEKAPKINITNWIENVPNDRDLSDKFIVLEFWATWCGPCIAAVPHMNKIQQEFKQKDLYFISITDESIEKVKRSLKRIDFNSIVVTDLTKQTQINFGDGIKGLETYPLTVLIDKAGIIKWIGEPKSLNSSVMSNFLANANVINTDDILEKDEIQKEQTKILDFKDLLNNKEIKYYFNLQETEGTGTLKQAIGTSIISLRSYKLEDIYKEIFNIKKGQLTLPKNLEDKRYNLIYKNIEESENIKLLEKEILQKLNLKKQTVLKPTKVNIISIRDQSLLEVTLEEMFSAKSDADDKIIFTAYTINGMIDELSTLSSEQFIYNGEDKTKYDFIIKKESKNDIIKSLKSYGLTVDEKDIKIEYVTIINGK